MLGYLNPTFKLLSILVNSNCNHYRFNEII